MKIYYLLILIVQGFILAGCSATDVGKSIEKVQIAMAGNKPPAYFTMANVETMRDYVFDTKNFRISPPFAKQKDFDVMGGWFGSSNRDGELIVLNLNHRQIGINYHVSVTTHTSKYTERERTIENGTIQYEKQRKIFNGRKTINMNVHTEYHGKEHYPCVVSKSYENYKEIRKYVSTYSCYKFNPQRTKKKRVSISITYTKAPNIPAKYRHLAKEYTYQDLKKRAKRMLDSLYIKDGW